MAKNQRNWQKAKAENQPEPEKKRVIDWQVGRDKSFGDDTPTKRITITIRKETYARLKLAATTTHEGYKTQNAIIDAALSAFLDDPSTAKEIDS